MPRWSWSTFSCHCSDSPPFKKIGGLIPAEVYGASVAPRTVIRTRFAITYIYNCDNSRACFVYVQFYVSGITVCRVDAFVADYCVDKRVCWCSGRVCEVGDLDDIFDFKCLRFRQAAVSECSIGGARGAGRVVGCLVAAHEREGD